MLIKFNPSIAGYANASIGTNKNTQSQPGFGAKIISFDDVAKAARQINATESDSLAQRLLDNLSYEVEKAGTKLKQQLAKEAQRLRNANNTELAELFEVLA